MTACPSHNRMGTRSEDDAVPMPPPDGDLQSVATIENHAPSVAHGSDLPPSPSQTHVTDMPPFWSTNRHNRAISSASYQSLNQNRPQAIILEDHSEEDHELAQACWAKSVTVDDYSVVSGPTGVGAYVVWHCTVCTLKGGDVEINKRYSEFDKLRSALVKAFPHADAMIPELPRKSTISRFRTKFLENRRNGLMHFMNCVLLNPEFASSPILKEFIFE